MAKDPKATPALRDHRLRVAERVVLRTKEVLQSILVVTLRDWPEEVGRFENGVQEMRDDDYRCSCANYLQTKLAPFVGHQHHGLTRLLGDFPDCPAA